LILTMLHYDLLGTEKGGGGGKTELQILQCVVLVDYKVAKGRKREVKGEKGGKQAAADYCMSPKHCTEIECGERRQRREGEERKEVVRFSLLDGNNLRWGRGKGGGSMGKKRGRGVFYVFCEAGAGGGKGGKWGDKKTAAYIFPSLLIHSPQAGGGGKERKRSGKREKGGRREAREPLRNPYSFLHV